MGTEVVDLPNEQRYEIRWDGHPVGSAAYQKSGRLVVFTHTEIDPSMEGRGIGGTLVREALDDVRRQGLHVLALCPFVQEWVARHPEYADLGYRGPASRVTD